LLRTSDSTPDQWHSSCVAYPKQIVRAMAAKPRRADLHPWYLLPSPNDRLVIHGDPFDLVKLMTHNAIIIGACRDLASGHPCSSTGPALKLRQSMSLRASGQASMGSMA
jgi:hypothetical protein